MGKGEFVKNIHAILDLCHANGFQFYSNGDDKVRVQFKEYGYYDISYQAQDLEVQFVQDVITKISAEDEDVTEFIWQFVPF